MSADAVLDQMAAIHFHEWVYHNVGAFPNDIASTVSYASLPDSERKMRRELMRSVLTVVVTAIDDEVLLDATNAGDIAMHQSAELSQRLGEWLET